MVSLIRSAVKDPSSKRTKESSHIRKILLLLRQTNLSVPEKQGTAANTFQGLLWKRVYCCCFNSYREWTLFGSVWFNRVQMHSGLSSKIHPSPPPLLFFPSLLKDSLQ